MNLEKRLEKLESLAERQTDSGGILYVGPPEGSYEDPSDAHVEQKRKEYESQHGYPPAIVIRVVYDKTKAVNAPSSI